jgi:hypothetical protein
MKLSNLEKVVSIPATVLMVLAVMMNGKAGILMLLLPFLWLIWMLCAMFHPPERGAALRLIRQWMIVDLVLLVILLESSSFGSHQGGDIIVLFACGPVIIPVGLIFALPAGSGLEPSVWLSHLVPVQFSGAVETWFDVSVIAAAQCSIFATVSRTIGNWWNRDF